jgi:hypothetical protein
MVTSVRDPWTEFTWRSILDLEAAREFFTASKTRLVLRCTLSHFDSQGSCDAGVQTCSARQPNVSVLRLLTDCTPRLTVIADEAVSRHLQAGRVLVSSPPPVRVHE